MWGPFMSDGSGRVDWVKVHALGLVMGVNLKEAREEGWGERQVEIPEGWDSTRSSAGQGRDWAGVEKQVSRKVFFCFGFLRESCPLFFELTNVFWFRFSGGKGVARNLRFPRLWFLCPLQLPQLDRRYTIFACA